VKVPEEEARAVALVVVRHGETAWNREGRIQGHGDSPLTERGLAQAQAVAGRLARERVDALYSSDLGRARDTARYLAASTHLEVRLEPGLRERAFGILEGKTWDELGHDHPDCARQLLEDPAYVIPGGESLVQFRERVWGALGRVAREATSGEAIAIVTHGGVLGLFYREAMGLSLAAPRRYTTLNASVNHFRYHAGRLTLVRWGDADHLGTVGGLDDP
jgi:probable phosphoglycerate mutase